MQIFQPDYFDQFRCIAGDCPDSCCKEWGVLVDEASAGYYRSLDGSLGERLRQVLREEDGQTVMTIIDGRCPMWRTDGLCRIQAELGEQALCQVCREFPRLTHDYGDFLERGLELSCPEAAKLILNAEPAPLLVRQAPGDTPPEYDQEAMEALLASRERMLQILADDRYSISQRLVLGLLYGYQAQGELDSGEVQPFDPEAALAEAHALARPGSIRQILDFFLTLEQLTPQWSAALRSPGEGCWEPRHLALARYLVQRYWLQAVADYDLYSRVKFLVTACLVVKHLGGDTVATAQLFSKEIENDADNVDALLDGAYTADALRDDRLLGLLLEK